MVLKGGRIHGHRPVWGQKTSQKRSPNGEYVTSRHPDTSGCNSLEPACWKKNHNSKAWWQVLRPWSAGSSYGIFPNHAEEQSASRAELQLSRSLVPAYGHPLQLLIFPLPPQSFFFGLSCLPCPLRQLMVGMCLPLSKVQLWIDTLETEFSLLHNGKWWST